MAKNVLQSTILSANGGVSVAPGASIEIRNATSGQLVPLWLDRDGTQPTPNPTTADGNGFFRVYTDAGRVHITARKDGKTQEWRDVVLPPDLYIGKSTTAPATPITGSLLSGAMLAAGAIVEQGENANGSYWRWESGLQVCVMNRIPNSQIPADTVYTATIPFPAEFVRDNSIYPLIFPVLAFGPSATNTFSFYYLGTAGITSSTFDLCAKVTVTQFYPIRAIAIGQWK